MKIIALVLVGVSLAGCSSRAVYENIQMNQRQACLAGPEAEFERCMERASKPFDEYDRERRQYLEERDAEEERRLR